MHFTFVFWWLALCMHSMDSALSDDSLFLWIILSFFRQNLHCFFIYCFLLFLTGGNWGDAGVGAFDVVAVTCHLVEIWVCWRFPWQSWGTYLWILYFISGRRINYLWLKFSRCFTVFYFSKVYFILWCARFMCQIRSGRRQRSWWVRRWAGARRRADVHQPRAVTIQSCHGRRMTDERQLVCSGRA